MNKASSSLSKVFPAGVLDHYYPSVSGVWWSSGMLPSVKAFHHYRASNNGRAETEIISTARILIRLSAESLNMDELVELSSKPYVLSRVLTENTLLIC